MAIKELSLKTYKDVVQNGLQETTLLRFTMFNEEALVFISERNEENDGMYVKVLTHEENVYGLIFGATLNTLNGDKTGTTYDEAAYYCQEGTTFTYFAVAMSGESNFNYLIPIIAGNETNGYYAIRSALMFRGFDMSSMKSPLE